MPKIRSITQRTKTWNPGQQARQEIRYVDVSAVSREKLQIGDVEAIPAATAPSRARKLIEADDTIIATIRPGLKRIAKVPPVLDGEVASTAFCVLRPDRTVVDPDYLFYAVASDDFISGLAAHETGASYPAIRDQDVLDSEIPLPSLDVQRRITILLNAVRASLLQQFGLIDAAVRLKAACTEVAFSRGLRGEAQKDTPIGLMPESWQPRSLPELCSIQSGGTPRKSEAAYWKGDIPWVSGKDLKLPALDDAEDHVTTEAIQAGSRLVPKDTVLLLVRGMGLAKDLPVAVITREMAFNQDIKALVPKGEFSGAFIRSAIYAGKERLLAQIVPSAHGTMTLNLNDVENFQIACPADPEEASEIAEILGALDAKIELHRKKRRVLEELFKALLHKLMTGEIDVNDLDLSALQPAT